MVDGVGLVANSTPYIHFASTGLPTKYGSWGLTEYTGQPAAQAPKLQALMDLLDAKQGGGGPNPTGCMDPSLGYRALGDQSVYGRPAIQSLRRGAVWVQVRAVLHPCMLSCQAGRQASQAG